MDVKELGTKVDDLQETVTEVKVDVAVLKSQVANIGKAFLWASPFVLGFACWLTLRVIDLPTKADVAKTGVASKDFMGPPPVGLLTWRLKK